MAAQAVGHYYDLFVMRKHGLAQGHDSLRGVRTPTCESGASVPGSEKKTLAHLVLCSTRHMGTTIVANVWNYIGGRRETKRFMSCGQRHI